MTTPIVFIHGLLGVLRDLNVPAHFAPRPVLVPDLLGYGENRHAALDAISLTGQADFLAAQIQALRFVPAHIVGHSVGGAIAVVLAQRHPHLVASIVNVEGNFTLKDAFWSRKIAAMTPEEVESLLGSYRADPAGWLVQAGIRPTPQRVRLAERGLRAQPAMTLLAMSRSVVTVTAQPEYLNRVRVILESGTPFHLVAGENSRAGWDVPEYVLRAAASLTVQPGVGHMMMLEEPEAFLGIIGSLTSNDGAAART